MRPTNFIQLTHALRGAVRGRTQLSTLVQSTQPLSTTRHSSQVLQSTPAAHNRDSGRRVLLEAAAWITAGGALVLLSQHTERSSADHAESIPSEERDWLPTTVCTFCGHFDPYLDAASLRIRCAQCDGEYASDSPALLNSSEVKTNKPQPFWYREGLPGWTDLGDGAKVLFLLAAFSKNGKKGGAIPECEGHDLMSRIKNEVTWEHHADILDDGAEVRQPRLISYQAVDPSNPKFIYSYPNLDRPLEPKPMSPTIKAIKDRVEELTGETFNTVHLNLYRSGSDHISWHTDEDVNLYGSEPVICSVSFGSQRDFLMRKMSRPSERIKFTLAHESVLVMTGTTQRDWEHAVRKQSNADGERINMTFRRVI